MLAEIVVSHEDYLYLRKTPRAQGFFSEPRRFCVLNSSRLFCYEGRQVNSFAYRVRSSSIELTTAVYPLFRTLR